MSLAERLRSWAQNEEMIDQYYTEHGRDCIEVAALLETVRDNISTLMCAYPDRFPRHALQGTYELLLEATGCTPSHVVYRCTSCGEVLMEHEVDGSEGHTRTRYDRDGNPVPTHCGPVRTTCA